MSTYDRGGQAARTALSWNRTSLGLWANGGLLLIRRPPSTHAPLDLILAVLEFGLALAVGLVARRRVRALRRDPLTQPVAARRQLLALGWTVAGISLATGIGLAL